MIGRQLGRYRLVEKIGEGGNGVVFRATDTRLDRDVAVKVLSRGSLTDAARVRFRQEALILSRLNHPNVGIVHDFDTEDGTDFLVMEFVEGKTLDERLALGPLTEAEAVRLGRQLAEGLDAAHRAGVVHRDLKPGNLRVTPDGRLKILDFGLAMLHEPVSESLKTSLVLEESLKTSPVLDTEGVSGTMPYMSPEQLKGDDTDTRTDIYSAGCVLYECVTGKRPHRQTLQTRLVDAILHEPPVPPRRLNPSVSAAYEQVVMKALQKDPARRYASASALGAELQRLDEPGGTWSELARRRVPHVVGIGAAIAVGAFLAVRIASQKLQISPDVAELSGWILLLLLPLAGWIAWARGVQSPGKRLFPPIAFTVLGAALLFSGFRGKDLGRVTTTVSLKNEDGSVVERVVPKTEHRKHVMLYYPESDDPELPGIFLGLLVGDLSQDPFLDLRYPHAFPRRLREAGYPDGKGLPPAEMRTIAQEYHSEYFLSGNLSRTASGYRVSMQINDTARGKVVATRELEAASLFALADLASVQLRKDVGVPGGYIDEHTDVPVAEITTTSEEALREASRAVDLVVFENDFASAKEPLERAVALDPSYAGAHFLLFYVYSVLQATGKADEAIEAAIRHIHRVDERTGFNIKATYYANVEKDSDKALAILEMWERLLPDDLAALQALVNYHYVRGETNEAIAKLERLLTLDPNAHDERLTLGSLYEQIENFPEAERTYRDYADRFPKDPKPLLRLGSLKSRLGDLEAAKKDFEAALLLEPDNMPGRRAIAQISERLGRFDEAEASYRDLLAKSRTPDDRYGLFKSLHGLANLRGRLESSLPLIDSVLVYGKRTQNPFAYLGEASAYTGFFAEAGKKAEAAKRLAALQDGMSEDILRATAGGQTRHYLDMKDPVKANERLDVFEAYLKEYRVDFDIVKEIVNDFRGEAAELRGDATKALEYYERALSIDPQDPNYLRNVGRCRRLLGRSDEAKEALDKSLRLNPGNPRTHYEMGALLKDMGLTKEALGRLNRAIELWEGADPGYERLEKAKELRATITTTL